MCVTGISVLSQTNTSELIGRWESVNYRPPKALQMEFKKNNEFVLTNLLVADYKYRVEGNMLISSLERDQPVKKIIIDTSYLQIKQDTIVRSYNRLGWKDTVTMIRDRNFHADSGGAENFIVGKWKWAYPMGDTATAVFSNNGTWHFFYPQDIYDGTYNIKNDTLSIKLNANSKARIHTFKIEGKLLELKDIKSGNQFLYRKMDN